MCSGLNWKREAKAKMLGDPTFPRTHSCRAFHFLPTPTGSELSLLPPTLDQSSLSCHPLHISPLILINMPSTWINKPLTLEAACWYFLWSGESVAWEKDRKSSALILGTRPSIADHRLPLASIRVAD